MENEEHQKVELYIPRKCSVTHRLIESGDKASIQFNVCMLDKDGVMIKGIALPSFSLRSLTLTLSFLFFLSFFLLSFFTSFPIFFLLLSSLHRLPLINFASSTPLFASLSLVAVCWCTRLPTMEVTIPSD